MLTEDRRMTDGRTTDTFIYYKLTFGSGELKSIIYVKAYVLSMYAKFKLHPTCFLRRFYSKLYLLCGPSNQ